MAAAHVVTRLGSLVRTGANVAGPWLARRRCAAAATKTQILAQAQVPGERSFSSAAKPLPDQGEKDMLDDIVSRSVRKRNPWERSSMVLPGISDDEDQDDWIREEVDRFAPMQPWPLTMGQVLEMLDPIRLAKFLHVEVPVRVAERIRWIEDIPDWEKVPELVAVHGDHWQAFRDMRLVRRKPTLDKFTAVVTRVATSMEDMRHVLAFGMQRLAKDRGDDFGSSFADPWLDKFLLNHIGTDMLMAQYLACVKAAEAGLDTTSMAGIIDPCCDVAQLCRSVANEVIEVCDSETGKAPLLKVETYSASGEDKGVPRFSFIPGYLRFMVREVLKNSCRATAVKIRSARELPKRPITIIVCADDHRVAIRIMDRAGGIPFDVGKDVWSYLFSTTGKGAKYGEEATPLSGYGVGLPLSRLYAKYLGGSIRLVSLPGYGTSVDLFLRRVTSEQVEVVPDEDSEPEKKRGISLSQPKIADSDT